jgi:hypothetical protein
MIYDQMRCAALAYPAKASFFHQKVPGSIPVVMLHGLGGDSGQLSGLPWGPGPRSGPRLSRTCADTGAARPPPRTSPPSTCSPTMSARSAATSGCTAKSCSSLAERIPGAARSLLAHFDTSQPQRMAKMLRAMPASAPYSAPGDLQHVACPALIVGNKDDPMHPIDLAQRSSTAIPGARFIEAPPRCTSAAEHAREVVDVITYFVTSRNSPDHPLMHH